MLQLRVHSFIPSLRSFSVPGTMMGTEECERKTRQQQEAFSLGSDTISSGEPIISLIVLLYLLFFKYIFFLTIYIYYSICFMVTTTALFNEHLVHGAHCLISPFLGFFWLHCAPRAIVSWPGIDLVTQTPISCYLLLFIAKKLGNKRAL